MFDNSFFSSLHNAENGGRGLGLKICFLQIKCSVIQCVVSEYEKGHNDNFFIE